MMHASMLKYASDKIKNGVPLDTGLSSGGGRYYECDFIAWLLQWIVETKNFKTLFSTGRKREWTSAPEICHRLRVAMRPSIEYPQGLTKKEAINLLAQHYNINPDSLRRYYNNVAKKLKYSCFNNLPERLNLLPRMSPLVSLRQSGVLIDPPTGPDRDKT